MKTLLILLFISFYSYSFSLKDMKFRARESFDIYSVEYQGNDYKYKGLSNTISWGLEKPGKYYYALFINPLLANDADLKDSSSPFGEGLRLTSVGVEAKQLFDFSQSFFVRGSVSWSQLVSDNLPAQDGFSAYASLGYEYYITPSISVAPEFGIRKAKLDSDIDAEVKMISIGVHFYDWGVQKLL